jgi:hypothetical protein
MGKDNKCRQVLHCVVNARWRTGHRKLLIWPSRITTKSQVKNKMMQSWLPLVAVQWAVQTFSISFENCLSVTSLPYSVLPLYGWLFYKTHMKVYALWLRHMLSSIYSNIHVRNLFDYGKQIARNKVNETVSGGKWNYQKTSSCHVVKTYFCFSRQCMWRRKVHPNALRLCYLLCYLDIDFLKLSGN